MRAPIRALVCLAGAALLPAQNLTGVKAIAASGNTSFALLSDGTVWGWGEDSALVQVFGGGVFGDGPTTPVRWGDLTDVAAVSPPLALKADGTVWSYWYDSVDPSSASAPVKGLPEVVAVAGGWTSLALTSNGTVWSIGWIVPAPVNGLSDVMAIATGTRHCLAVKRDGTVWAWGDNADGHLGDGLMLGPETAPADPVPVQVPGLTDVKAVAAGGGHSLALKSDGTVWAWGWNGDGQLGDGTTRSRTAPVQVSGLTGVVRIAAGGAHSLAVKDDGTVWAWGSNAGGQLGDGTTMDRLTPVQVKTLSGATTVAAGRFHSLALKEDGTLWAWGDDQFGQLGDAVELPPPVWRAGRLGPMQAGGLSGVAKIAAGTTHNLALKTDGTLWAWGENSYGQLGNGIARPWDWPARSKPVQVTGPAAIAEIAGDGSLSLAVTDDGSVWTWGVDDSGWQAVPVRVEGLSGVAVAAAACGFYSYPFEFPEYGLAGRPGPYYLAVQSDGNLWEWGARYGGSYFGRPSPVRAFTEVAAAAPGLLRNLVLKRDGTVWEWKTTASGPSPVNGLTNTVAVTATDCIEEPCCCSLALKRDGTVWLWEAPPRFGRLPQRIAPAPLAGLDDVTAIASRGNHHIALKRDGTVWEWFIYEGNATKSLVPVPVAGLTDIIMIAAGAGHGLALRRDGTVWAWGENVYGQLGTQSITARTVPVQVVAPAP